MIGAQLKTDDDVKARYAHMSPGELRLARTRLGVEPRDIDGPPVAMLVGEAPPKTMQRCLPLFPWPASSSGGRLLKMSGIAPAVYFGRFYRRNVFDEYPGDKWPALEARERGFAIKRALADLGDMRVLLMGAAVGEAFGLEPGFFRERVFHFGEHKASVIAIPHPSGRTRLYNDPSVRLAARGALLWAARLA